MTTQLETLTRQIAAQAGIPLEAALREAQLKLGYEAGQASQAAVAQREAETPRPAFSFDRYDAIDRRAAVDLDRSLDQNRAAVKAARRAEIEQQAAAIRTQRDALNRQLQALDDEWRDNL